jgi:aryl-alcohol dehydrogenase-like predicted oxidoreductase
MRKLGKTGVSVPIISLGGQGSLETQGNEENCLEIIQRAFDLGIRYFDTSPLYGPSQEYYGKVIPAFRKKIFLATKTDKRKYDEALKDIEKSLKTLKTDHVDLLQIHHIDNMEDVTKSTGKDGALKALMELKEQKVIKHIGVTGHANPDLLLEMFDRYDFETVLCPVNAADRHMKPPFIDTVLKRAKKLNMGIIGMKVFAQGYLFNDKLKTAYEALCYSLSQSVSTLIIGHDTVEQLEQNIALVKSFQQFDSKKQKDTEEKTKGDQRRGCFFRSIYGGYDSKKKLEPPQIVGK